MPIDAKHEDLSSLRIDRTVGVQILGGAIESTGIPIQLGSKAEAVYETGHGTILAVDFENPGDGNPFLEAGYGWTGALGQGVRAWDIRACQGWPSGTLSAPSGIKLKHTTAMSFDNNHWVQPGTPTATYWLEGATNVGTVVRASRSNAGYAYPWVMANGVTVPAATPSVDWIQP